MDEGPPDELVDQQILTVRKARGKKTIVQDRPLRIGDLSLVSFEARRLSDDAIMPGTQHERMQLDTTSLEQIPLPGLRCMQQIPSCLFLLLCVCDWST